VAKFSDESVRHALRGRGEVRRYQMPGATGEIFVGLKVPTDAELDGARLRGVELCKKSKVDPKYDPDFLEHAIMREVIALSFVDIDQQDEAFFGSADEVAELDEMMVKAMHELYLTHFVAMDPYAFVSGEEAAALADQLGKSERPEERLSVYDLPTLRGFALSLASLLRETRASPKSPTT
jgi:hypothetical protein